VNQELGAEEMNLLHWVALAAVTSVALAQQEKPVEGPRHWNELGLAAVDRGDTAEAERLFRQAIDGWLSMGPQFDAHRGTGLVNLGQALCSKGDRHEGAVAFEEALGLYRKTIGVENELALAAANLLASARLMLGESAKAEVLLSEIVVIERAKFPKSVQLARTLAGFTIMYTNRGRPDLGIPMIDEALRIAIAADGEINPDVALEYTVAAEAHRVAKHYDQALPLYRKARFIYSKFLDPEHPRIASILGQEGLILMMDNKLALADKNMTQALEIVRKRCPGCIIEQWVAESNLGMLRYKQKRYAEADQLLSHALDLQERDSPRPGPDLVSTIQALAMVRQKLNRPEDATRLNQRATMLMSLR
jgi:tetratricopeptide (TPR) repeat protein